jgi:tRNA threonylcarbamoyladenosine biosynthesis protein TsaE
MVQGIARGMGIEEQVTSPTFVLVNEYADSTLPLYHIDLYRIVDVKAAYTFGLDDYLYGDGVCAIEWAERVEDLWPDEYLLVGLRHLAEAKRGLTFRGVGERYNRLLQSFRRAAFGI